MRSNKDFVDILLSLMQQPIARTNIKAIMRWI